MTISHKEAVGLKGEFDALQWKNAGFTANEACQWITSGVGRQEASSYRQAKITPDEVAIIEPTGCMWVFNRWKREGYTLDDWNKWFLYIRNNYYARRGKVPDKCQSKNGDIEETVLKVAMAFKSIGGCSPDEAVEWISRSPSYDASAAKLAKEWIDAGLTVHDYERGKNPDEVKAAKAASVRSAQKRDDEKKEILSKLPDCKEVMGPFAYAFDMQAGGQTDKKCYALALAPFQKINDNEGLFQIYGSERSIVYLKYKEPANTSFHGPMGLSTLGIVRGAGTFTYTNAVGITRQVPKLVYLKALTEDQFGSFMEKMELGLPQTGQRKQ